VFAALLALAWALWRVPGLQRFARLLVALCAWQFLTGLTNVVLDWPLLAAVSHTGGAAALVIVFTGAVASTRAQRPAAASLLLSEAMR
jgi:heme a synthase